MHVHIVSPDGEAKFWLEPIVSLAMFEDYRPKDLKRLQRIVDERQDEIRKAWRGHFGR